MPIADAIAASAAFPELIGFLVLRTADFTWSRFDGRTLVPADPPPFRTLHPWDGGVYDNLGVEALFKLGRAPRYRDEFNFLIVSDASGGLAESPTELAYYRPKRLLDIPMDQVRGLRSRQLVDHFAREPDSGAFLRIGGSAKYILAQANLAESRVALRVQQCLSESDATAAAGEGTHLRRLSKSIFDRLCRHGWEVADCTLSGYCPNLLPHRPWIAPWAKV